MDVNLPVPRSISVPSTLETVVEDCQKVSSMTSAQQAELQSIVASSLSSATIEWAMNLRVCNLLQANPSMGPQVRAQWRGESEERCGMHDMPRVV